MGYADRCTWDIRPLSLDGLSTIVSGSGQVTIYANVFWVRTGTTSGSTASLYIIRHPDFPFGFGVNSQIFVQFNIAVMNTDGLIARVYTGNFVDHLNHYGFKFTHESGEVKCYASNADGTTEKTTDITSGINFVAVAHRFEAIFTAGQDIKYYIDGDLKATHTDNLPTQTNPGFNWIIRTENPGVASIVGVHVAQIVHIYDWW